jgi:hypothetical protein
VTVKNVNEPYETRQIEEKKEVKASKNPTSLLKHGNPSGKPNNAPRCGAKKRQKATFCQAPAMPNGRCRLHGGLSTGPKTQEGLEQSRKANWKHGFYSAESKLMAQIFRQEFQTMKASSKSLR